MFKRSVTLIVVCVAGAAINVALAVGCAMLAQQRPGQLEILDWRMAEELFDLGTRHHAANANVRKARSWGARMTRFGYRELMFLSEAELEEASDEFPLALESLSVVEIEAGWPFKSLVLHPRTYEEWYEWMMLFGSFAAAGRPRVASADAAGFMIPRSPDWKGFVVNSLLYAAILWLALVAIPGTRRFLRHRRGLCPRCAYPIGSSDRCTECGQRV